MKADLQEFIRLLSDAQRRAVKIRRDADEFSEVAYQASMWVDYLRAFSLEAEIALAE